MAWHGQWSDVCLFDLSFVYPTVSWPFCLCWVVADTPDISGQAAGDEREGSKK